MTTTREDPRFKKYPVAVDIERLRLETDKILWQPDVRRYKDQLSLQTDGSGDWNSSIGSREGQFEGQWDKLHPDLIGTWWEEFLASLPFKVYRARLMTMHPRTCYSIHVDDNPRIHIAIKTHRQARFIFTKPTVMKHIPSDGSIWWVDTRYEHSAMNGHTEDRIHLVASLVNNTKD
jgi:hypothetical protein